MTFKAKIICLIIHDWVQHKNKFARKCTRCGKKQYRFPWDMNRWIDSIN